MPPFPKATAASLVISLTLPMLMAVHAVEMQPLPAFVSPHKLPSPFLVSISRHSRSASPESRHPIPRAAPSNHALRRRRRRARSNAAIDDAALENSTIERLELDQQFERWRFFQRLLEGELPPSDVEDVLLLVLRAYLLHGPTANSANNRAENGGNASPVLTEEQRSAMEAVVEGMASASDGIGDSRFLHMLVLPPVDYESITIDVEDDDASGGDGAAVAVDPTALSLLGQIEGLLPDPVEDEEAHQSAWDVVIDLYGRESVRVKEEALYRETERRGGGDGGDGSSECDAENLQWRTLCAVCRVLIHYDFLTKGVLNERSFL